MIQPSTLKFLTGLSKNNNKPWFDEHKKEYDLVKTDFEHFVTGMLEKMGGIESELPALKAKDCIFRIYRDVRFSKDKTPYKAHLSAVFSKGGRKHSGAGYYLHLEPGKSFAGGGIWMPEKETLKPMRQEIDYNFEEFKKIIGGKEFKTLFKKPEGEQLKTVPQGYNTDNPAIEYLKMKSIIVEHQISDKELSSTSLQAKCLHVFTVMKPLVDFINRSLD
ncbi:MAG: DUF2461 domain-containing protein [Taibaiella sp.]|nr:DUF2461 domain-containing protein [Taibaiella sp.]